MTNEQLREKIVLLGIKAVEKCDDYYERARYLSEELDKEETGRWGCLIADTSLVIEKRVSTCYVHFNENNISFRIGKCHFNVKQQSK